MFFRSNVSTYRRIRRGIFPRPPRLGLIASRFVIDSCGSFSALPEPQPLFLTTSDNTRRLLSTGDEIEGKFSAIVESAKANTQWKRGQYREIEAKFQDTSDTPPEIQDTQQLEPLIIDNYEDVQPMWKGMESRVTKRAALTLEQRGGVSGRRNVRKSEEDMWLESGLYETDHSVK